MNDVLVSQISKYSLLGDLTLSEKDFNHLAAAIKILYGNGMNRRFSYLFKECLSVFIVFCAVYEYEDRTFWRQIEEYLGELSQNRRIELYSIFSRVLEEYKLHKFENESEEGRTYVTPILCHAGIPINSLNTYFEAISNTVNDNFYDDFDVDDYLSYLKNKTERTVQRYLKLSNKRDSYNFIQNTKKLILSDSVDQDEELFQGNYLRMYEQITLWMEKPKVKKNLQARSNVQITAPKIKLDFDGIGVYCELPRIIVKDSYDSYLIWEIALDETTNLVKADFFKRSGVLVSEEKIMTLRPTMTYSIILKVDDNVISKWEFDGVKGNYLAFSSNGHVIKTEALPNNSVILLLNKSVKIIEKEELPFTELPAIPLWTEFNVYQMDLSNLKVISCEGFTIPVRSENKPVLAGGKALFNQENARAYMDLPYIKVPIINEGEWHLEIKHQVGSNFLQKSNHVVEAGRDRIMLSSFIQNGCFGEYDIKIWNRAGFNGRFILEYVPYSTFIADKNEYWPSSHQGYVNNTRSIRTGTSVELEVYNAEKVAELNRGDHKVYRYKVNERDRFLIGEYRYQFNGNTFSTSIKKSIHPISWGIIGIENELIDLSSKVYTLTLENFATATDPYLLFAFDFDLQDEIEFLKFDLVGSDQMILQSHYVSIDNKDGLRIPLNSFLFEVQNAAAAIDYQLRVSLYDSREFVATSFLVARLQEEVVVVNAQFTQTDTDIHFKWEESGTCCGRECVLVNFLKPWEAPYHFKIEDKSCELHILNESLTEGVYRYLIQKEKDDLFFDEVEAEICSLSNFQKGRIIIRGENHFSTDLVSILYRLLRSRFLKKEQVPRRLAGIESEIPNLQVKVPEDIHYISAAYILHERFLNVKDDAPRVVKIFDSLFDLFSSYGKETIKYVLESDFSTSFKKDLLHKFYCTNLTSAIRFNDLQMKLLSEIDEDMAGFINLIQSEQKMRGLNWAGISDLGVLREEDLFGDGECEATFLSDENLGKSSYINDYFNYVYDCLQRPKNLSKRTDDFLREFQRDKSVQETSIFGKTRLHLLVDWRDKNKDFKMIQAKLSDVIDIPCNHELKLQFSDAFQAISKRKYDGDDELGHYIGLIALYASFIRNGLMKDRKEFSKLLNFTIRKCGKLYYRDALLIELYMNQERRYSWA
jgi:hypothetical protein